MNDVRMKKVERIIKNLDDLNYQILELQEEEAERIANGAGLDESLYCRFVDGTVWNSAEYLDMVLLEFDVVIRNLKVFRRKWKVT